MKTFVDLPNSSRIRVSDYIANKATTSNDTKAMNVQMMMLDYLIPKAIAIVFKSARSNGRKYCLRHFSLICLKSLPTCDVRKISN